jgi:hypothetical protein
MDLSGAGGSTSPKAMADSPQAQVSAANPHLQRVEDNAFHQKKHPDV